MRIFRIFLVVAALATGCSTDNSLTATAISDEASESSDASSESDPPAPTTTQTPATTATTIPAAPETTATPLPTTTEGPTTDIERTASEREFLATVAISQDLIADEASLEIELGPDDDDVALAMGYAICEGLEAGDPVVQLTIEISNDFGYTPFTVGAVAAIASESLCPEQAGVLDGVDEADLDDPDAVLISTVRFAAGDDFVDELGEQTILDLAQDTCDRLEAGEDLGAVLIDAISTSGSSDFQNMGVAIGAGIGVRCPEFLEELSALAE